ncbi:MAG: hypothetical protein WC867_00795 [Candidatus Pacearchaeota archaeon]|jgi:hypothetical protein
MNSKKVFKYLVILTIVAVIAYILIYSYIDQKKIDELKKINSESSSTKQSSTVNTPPKPSSAAPSPPSPSTSKPSSPSTSKPTAPSPPQVDTYKLPDFNKLQETLAKEPIINDFPKAGNMRLRFYHFYNGNRIWDKSFYITQGSIVAKDTTADIDIWMSSDYASVFNGNNLCDTVQDARTKGHLGQDSGLTKTQLLWKYSGMVKYKSCFGI